MASTIVTFAARSGLGSLTATLLNLSDTVQNSAGDTATEDTNGQGTYRFTVTEALSGEFLLSVDDSGGTTVASWYVHLEDDTATHPAYEGRSTNTHWLSTAVTISSTTAKPEMDAFSISNDSTAANNLELDYDGTGLTRANSTIGTVTLATTTTNVTNQVTADVTAISGDTTAANNLELQYDGTGVVGDPFPATQAQVNSTATGGGGIKTLATAVVITTGTQSSGTVVSTEELDGTLHIIDNAAGSTEFYYEFNVNSIGIGTAVIWDGFVGNNGDEVQVSYFDWTSTTFKQVGAISGQNSSTINSQNFDIPLGATDDNGDIRIQFVSTDAVDTNTDRIWLEFTSVAAQAIILANGTAQSGGTNSIQLESGDVTIDDQFRRAKVIITSGTGVGQEAICTSSVASTHTLTVATAWLTNPDSTSGYIIIPGQVHATTRNGGYDGGQIFVDTVNGTAGTEIGVNGTSTNPSSNFTDPSTIS